MKAGEKMRSDKQPICFLIKPYRTLQNLTVPLLSIHRAGSRGVLHVGPSVHGITVYPSSWRVNMLASLVLRMPSFLSFHEGFIKKTRSPNHLALIEFQLLCPSV